MKAILSSILALGLSACSSTSEPEPSPIQNITCSTGRMISAGLSFEMAAQLNCQRPDVLEQLFHTEVLVRFNLCPEVGIQKSFIAGMCENVGSHFVNVLMSETLPASAQCEGGAAKETLLGAVKDACSNLR